MSDKVMGMHPYMGRGILVFFSGMALAGLSFVVENLIIKAAKGSN